MTERIFTAAEKLKAVGRELGYRRRVYERRVAAGLMHESKKAAEIAVMEAIAADYRALAEKDRLL